MQKRPSLQEKLLRLGILFYFIYKAFSLALAGDENSCDYPLQVQAQIFSPPPPQYKEEVKIVKEDLLLSRLDRASQRSRPFSSPGDLFIKEDEISGMIHFTLLMQRPHFLLKGEISPDYPYSGKIKHIYQYNKSERANIIQNLQKNLNYAPFISPSKNKIPFIKNERYMKLAFGAISKNNYDEGSYFLKNYFQENDIIENFVNDEVEHRAAAYLLAILENHVGPNEEREMRKYVDKGSKLKEIMNDIATNLSDTPGSKELIPAKQKQFLQILLKEDFETLNLTSVNPNLVRKYKKLVTPLMSLVCKSGVDNPEMVQDIHHYVEMKNNTDHPVWKDEDDRLSKEEKKQLIDMR